MRLRHIAVALSVTALTLAVGSPMTGQAAPAPQTPSAAPTVPTPAVAVPSGKALVRLDGGTARATKVGKRHYRLVVPKKAMVTWAGEVQGKGLRVGTFTQAGLIQGWQRLGHRAGTRVTATITWQSPEGTTLTSVGGLGAPKRDGKGHLVFSVRMRDALPATLSGFSINVQRAQGRTPRYDVEFSPTPLTASMAMTAAAGGDQSASAYFVTLNSDGSVAGNCDFSQGQPSGAITPANPKSFSGGGVINYTFGPAACADVSMVAREPVNNLPTKLQYSPATSTNGHTVIDAFIYFTAPSATEAEKDGVFYFVQTVASWGHNGSGACPVLPTYPCS